MREFIQKNGRVVAPVCIALAIVIWFVFGRSSAAVPKGNFFIDEDTNIESVRPVIDVPPLVGAKGNLSIVKVYKYTSSRNSTPKVAYYIKYTPEMKAKLDEANKHPDQTNDIRPDTGMLVRTPESGATGWVAALSNEGQKIIAGDPADTARETVYP